MRLKRSLAQWSTRNCFEHVTVSLMVVPVLSHTYRVTATIFQSIVFALCGSAQPEPQSPAALEPDVSIVLKKK